MSFEIVDQGMIARQPSIGPDAVAACSRCVVTADVGLVCSFAVQEALGQNDFKQVIVRSEDGGSTWTKPAYLWPHLHDDFAHIGSISQAPDGTCFITGIRIPIDEPGESFWLDETQGIKQNAMYWATSTDQGLTWTDPAPIVLPTAGSAEAPGALTVTRDGTWICCYSPYNTFDPAVEVDRNRVVCLRSTDQGKSWTHGTMLRFDDAGSTAAEAWVVELADGRLLGACWHIAPHGKPDYPNAYALSHDGGLTWTPTRATGTLGQSVSLTALEDGRALMTYNQRQHGGPGIRLAVARPTDDDFGVEADELVWKAEVRTQSDTSGDHDDWQDYSFGEPAVTVLPDGAFLVVFWLIQPDVRGIGYVKVR